MKTVKFAQVLKFSENLVKVDKPEEERYVTVLLYGRGVIEREIKEGKVPVAFTGYKAHAGQLIISTINARNGAAGIIPAELDGAVVSKDFPLFDIDHECVDEQYLLYYLWSDSFIHKAEQNSFGATMPRLHVKPFLNMQMRLPALSEQKRRAHTLCHVESLLNTQSHLLTKLDELVKSRFVEMFGELKTNPKDWSVKPFEDFAQIDGNMTTDYEKYADYPHIGIDSIEKETGELKGYRTVREDGVISGKYLFTPKHIIYSKIRPNLNKVALPMFDGLCSADAYPILPNPENCNRVFLAIAMRSKYYLDYILQFSSRTNLPKVNRKEIAGFRMPLPPLELQNRFAAFVAEVDKSKLSYEMEVAA